MSPLSFLLTLILSVNSITAGELFPKVTQYEKLITKFNDKKRTIRLVDVYRAGEEALEEVAFARGESPGLERFSIQLKKMSGLRVEEGEQGLYTWIESKYFRKLAENGSVEDREFFDLLAKIKPGDIRFLFDVQMTDFGGCTDLGTGTLSEVYKTLVAFQKKFPQSSYDKETNVFLRTTVDSIGDTCLCAENEHKPVEELKSISKKFPGTNAAEKARDIMEKLEKKTHKPRFHCAPG